MSATGINKSKALLARCWPAVAVLAVLSLGGGLWWVTGDALFSSHYRSDRLHERLEIVAASVVIMVVLVAWDRARRGHAVEAERNRFLDVLERLPAYVILLTPDYHVAFSNRVFRERFGESAGRRCFEFLFHRDSPCEICETYKVLESKAPLAWQWTGPDGRHYDISDFPFLDADGTALILEMGVDVTDRDNALEQARQQAALLHLTPAAILVRDLESRVMFWSRGAEELYGWTAEEARGRSTHELLRTEFPQPLQEIEARVLAGEVWQGELWHTRRSGERIAVGSRWALRRDAEGEPVGFLEVNVDITERLTAEVEMHRLNRALKALNHCTEALVRATDEMSLLQQVCDIFVQIGGYPLAWVGYAVDDKEKTVEPVAIAGLGVDYVRNAHITWADTERGRGPTGTAIRTGQPCYISDIAADPRFTPWRQAAARQSYASAIAVPLKDGDQTLGAVNIYAPEANAFDQEERTLMVELAANLSQGILAFRMREEHDGMDAELVLRARQQQAAATLGQRALAGGDLQPLMDETVDVVASTLDVELCKVLELLPAGDALLLRAGVGWTPGLVGRGKVGAGLDSQAGYTLAQHEPVIVADLRSETRFTGPPLLHDHGVRSGMSVIIAGRERPFGVLGVHSRSLRSFSTEDVHFLQTVANLLAEAIARKTAEDALWEAHEKLEQKAAERTAELAATNQELESFTYSVSHDLRAPLRHIDGFSKVLLDDYSAIINEEGKHYLGRVRQATQRMGRLIDDLLKLSRIGRAELRHDPVELDPLVREIVDELSAELNERAVEWKIARLPVVRGDAGLLRQVFFNLLSNAVKFTRGREPAMIEVGMRGGEFFVRDNGVGFDPRYADKLFGVFQRLHRPEDFEGTGVGLATVRRILRKHGGDIRVEAALDAGATFYFNITQAATEAAAVSEVFHAA